MFFRNVWFYVLALKVHILEWAFWNFASCAGCVWLFWHLVIGARGGYHLYLGLLQSRWYPVDVADSLTFFLQRLFFFGLNSSDVSRIHISCFLFWFLVFKQQVKSLLYSLSRDRLLFNQIPFRQLCVNWFVGILDPVKRVDLVEGYKQLYKY